MSISDANDYLFSDFYSRLKHPAVLELHSFCEDSNFVYMVLELCSNGELLRYIEERAEPLSESQGMPLIRCLAFCSFTVR